jgi:hypothetical protein
MLSLLKESYVSIKKIPLWILSINLIIKSHRRETHCSMTTLFYSEPASVNSDIAIPSSKTFHLRTLQIFNRKKYIL